jgi:hypothetical protein
MKHALLSMFTAVIVALGVAPSLASKVAATPPTGFESSAGGGARTIDNPYFPLVPGTTFVYKGSQDGEPDVDVVAVSHHTKVIDGVTCVEVHDHLYVKGRLAETTRDWYAQDRAGNVWYFGEATAELDRRGRVISTEGSWQAGVDGARPGIFMPAQPHVGDSFRQEFLKGHAEDHFKILSLSADVTVPAGHFEHVMLTKEWTPLEPGVIDHKFYAPGVGDVREDSVRGGDEHLRLVRVIHDDR